MVWHGEEHDDDTSQHKCHHKIVHIVPLVGVSQPCGEPCAELTDNHEEAVDDWLRHHFLSVDSVPRFFGGRFVAWGDIVARLNAESILDEHKQVCHHQRLAHEAHEQTAQSEHEK